MTSDITHLFASVAPAPGHLRFLVVFACKVLIAHHRLRPGHSLVITMPVTGSNIKAMADKEIGRCLHSEYEFLRESFHVISLGGEGILVPLLMHLMENFTPFYISLHKCEPITCQATGKVYTVSEPPSVVIADFFVYGALAVIAQLNEQDQKKKVPVLTWNCGALAPIMRLMGPKELGGIGNVEAQAIELAASTGITVDEAEALCFQPQKGEVVKVPGLPPMYDYEFFAKSEVLPPHLLKIQLMLHKQGYIMFHDLEGTISSSCTAFEPEACQASKEWYAKRNKSCYVVGPCVPDDLFDNVNEQRSADIDSSSAQEMEIMTFLDKVYETSGKHSVLYIAFGTLFSPSNARLWKFVEVVLDLEIPFLLAYGLEKMGDISEIPDHIISRINASPERALTRKWVPQQAVLAHKATGWFLTHCGNNGVFEAISQAVPMHVIAWALDAEQPGTAAHITLNLDIAFQLIEIRDGLGLRPMYRGCQPKGTMEALQEEARTVLHEAFHGEGGVRKRENIGKLRENVRAGIMENGDSTRDLVKFVEEYL